MFFFVRKITYIVEGERANNVLITFYFINLIQLDNIQFTYFILIPTLHLFTFGNLYSYELYLLYYFF